MIECNIRYFYWSYNKWVFRLTCRYFPATKNKNGRVTRKAFVRFFSDHKDNERCPIKDMFDLNVDELEELYNYVQIMKKVGGEV